MPAILRSPADPPGSPPPGASPKIQYWHAWTDGDGVSRQSRCEMARFALKGMGGAAPQWQDELGTFQATVNMSVLPVGWTGQWHENPMPQWIIPLSGAWFVETMDGTRVEMGPGDISFGEDQGCRQDERGRRGHLSGTVGDAPAVLMLVQLHTPPGAGQPCRFG